MYKPPFKKEEEMEKTIRVKVAACLWCLSGCLNCLGLYVANNDSTVLVDVLSLPGWRVDHHNLIRQKPGIANGLKNCISYDSWAMPDEYCQDMKKLSGKLK